MAEPNERRTRPVVAKFRPLPLRRQRDARRHRAPTRTPHDRALLRRQPPPPGLARGAASLLPLFPPLSPAGLEAPDFTKLLPPLCPISITINSPPRAS